MSYFLAGDTPYYLQKGGRSSAIATTVWSTTILIHFQLLVLEEHTRATEEMNDLRRFSVRSNHYDDLEQKCQTNSRVLMPSINPFVL